MNHILSPFSTLLLDPPPATPAVTDGFPACFRIRSNRVMLPANSIDEFISSELSLRRLEVLERHLWFAGEERSAWPLHHHILVGRKILITEQMDLHLLWANDGRIFIKPLSRFLLNPEFWSKKLSCEEPTKCKDHRPTPNTSRSPQTTNSTEPLCDRRRLRSCAMGFLYTYACLISYESDFRIANENNLLPCRSNGSTFSWEDWKKFVSEILAHYNKDDIHPRFHRADLRLARLNTIHRFTQLPLLEPYFRDWRNFGSVFRDNLTWLASATVFVALVLTAMQVGLATDQLKGSKSFMAASYGFTVFAILGPLCAFGLIILGVLHHLLKELPWLLRGDPTPLKSPPVSARSMSQV